MSNNRLQSCIVKDTKQIPPHKILMFNKRNKKPLQVLKKNVKIKPKPSFTVVATNMCSSSANSGEMELTDELCSNNMDHFLGVLPSREVVCQASEISDEYHSSESEHLPVQMIARDMLDPSLVDAEVPGETGQLLSSEPGNGESSNMGGGKGFYIGDLVWGIPTSELCYYPALIVGDPVSKSYARMVQNEGFEYYIVFLGTGMTMWLAMDFLIPYDGLKDLCEPEKEFVNKDWSKSVAIAKQLEMMDAKARIKSLIDSHD